MTLEFLTKERKEGREAKNYLTLHFLSEKTLQNVSEDKYRVFFKRFVVLKKTVLGVPTRGEIYLLLVYLVTALVPSETACFANSPGSKSRTAVWISRDEMVDFLF